MSSLLPSSFGGADLADWMTVAAYLLAACLSAQAARHANLRPQGRERMFWRITAVLLVALAVNELLDLQTLLTAVGKSHAQANGWYEERRVVQYAFVAGLGVAAVLSAILLLCLTRRTDVAVRVALVGLIFIALFVLLRAASFHHLNNILAGGAAEFNLGSVQEIAGIFLVTAAAMLYTGKHPRRR